MAIPFDLILLPVSTHWYRLLNVVRLLRVIRVVPSKFKSDQMLGLSKVEVAGLSLFWVVLFIHSLVCIWLAIASSAHILTLPSIVSSDEMAEHLIDVMSVYIDGLYYIMTVLSTVGYGDIVPTTPMARLFSVLLMVLTMLLNTVVISTCFHFLASIDEIHRMERNAKRQLARFMEMYDIPHQLRKQAYAVFPHIFKASMQQMVGAIDQLPPFLQKDITTHVKLKMLSSVPMFKEIMNNSQEVALKLAEAIKEQFLEPQAYLVERGASKGALYFLVEGMVEVLDIQNGKEVLLCHLQSGNWLGESALTEPTISVRALTLCVVYTLQREFLSQIDQDNPDLLADLHNKDLSHQLRSSGHQSMAVAPLRSSVTTQDRPHSALRLASQTSFAYSNSSLELFNRPSSSPGRARGPESHRNSQALR
eukprot:NODE_489_length_2158_cov_12.805515_g453_i0.p1 GENE.NODE_489_length_2158_cov_12.805515_g453_i0~~NODE_489_length_2158_cov_12.805515_g453_i0.p1  ORF type:complete len:420 (+),score=131.73 NODE_489_length_2158_cov_12.805515_g453_i0:728-1987(+)